MLLFSDHMARFYAKQYGFPPVAGRVLGYLIVCEPMEQSIAQIADALLTSRSAVTGAVKMLETAKVVVRTRPAGSRFDLVSIQTDVWQHGFDPAEYRELARLAREGLTLLEDASPERRRPVEDMASLGDFLAERIPTLYDEWRAHREKELQQEES
ncbi:MAG TPA: hypothetical protein VKU87_04675 [Thermomicrobiaceae bacterium]|nr:hypothetical protein [Thermomicrobiaceae bacterium]